MELTHMELRRVLRYEPDTGFWFRIGHMTTKSRGVIGAQVGCPNTSGYLTVRIGGKQYLLSRLAFLYMDGKFPNICDHINRDPMDNRWANLRDVSRHINNRNKGTHTGKTSVYRGVSKRGDKWLVVVRVMGKPKYIGAYLDEHEAGRVAAPYFEGIAP